VTFHSGEGNDSILQGFTIQNGHSSSTGGGIYINSSSPTISYCSIINNSASGSDYNYNEYRVRGGIYMQSSSPIISNCIIQGNSASSGAYYNSYSWGGGIFISGGNPSILNSTIKANGVYSGSSHGSAYSYGGGLNSTSSSPNIVSTSISENTVSGNSANGGGIYFSTSTPTIVNCTISNNTSQNGAGIFFDTSSTFSYVINSTIVRNTATDSGGGIYMSNTSPKIANSILWEDSPLEMTTSGTSNPTVTYSDVSGGYNGTGNINANPQFQNITQQDFHLKSTSSCRNVGNNNADYLSDTDKDGNPRIGENIVDMGAYEYTPYGTTYGHIAIGGGYQTIIMISNKSNSSWSGVGKATSNDSSLAWLTTNITLAPRQTTKIIFTAAGSVVTTGYQIDANSGSLNSSIAVTCFWQFLNSSSQLKDSIGVSQSQSAKKFTFPVELASTVNTGIAVRWRSTQTSSPISLTLYDNAGNQVQKVDNISGEFSKFFGEFFTGVTSPFIGSLVAESSSEFYLVAARLDGADPNFQYTFVDAETN
jgi:predicted outer membrane repeat protein